MTGRALRQLVLLVAAVALIEQRRLSAAQSMCGANLAVARRRPKGLIRPAARLCLAV